MQPFQKAACALLFAAALGGCTIGTQMDNGPTVMPELRTTETSPRNETLTASKDSIIYSEELGARHGAQLLKGVSGSYLPDDKITFIETHFDAPAGLELVAMTGAPVPMYCSLEPIFPLSNSACFFDADRDGTFDRIRPNGNRVDYFTKIGAMGMAIDPIPYEKKEPVGSLLNGRAELSYRGRDGDKIRFRYHGVLINSKAGLLSGRETGDFSRHYSFDLPDGGSREISVNGARVQVENATDSEITYRVLSPFRGFRFTRMEYRQY